MLVSDFDYHLPQELIAQRPAPKRDEARLMVLDKNSGATRHTVFRDVPSLLEPGDFIVMNDTRVFPARLWGKRGSGGKIEALVLGRSPDGRLRTLLKAGGRICGGEVISFAHDEVRIRVIEKDETGAWYFEPVTEGFWEKLEEKGEVPLPPYINRGCPAREASEDRVRYQTVFAKDTGSAAAPTAGLHFTPELLEMLDKKGISSCFVTLHIGYETFRPVKEDKVEEHVMHSEFFSVSHGALSAIEAAVREKRRIVAVGTTSCRVLETLAHREAGGFDFEETEDYLRGWTDIFIYPGFEFKFVGGMITNFHLPRSTLVMLVAALAGRENILAAYNEAVEMKYRFYSYGDAMMIK